MSGPTVPKGVNLRKLGRMAALAFRNALRLHEESIRLFMWRSYRSAFALSVISAEEIGKSILLEHVVWNAEGNKGDAPEEVHDWLTLTLNHRVKQSQFVRHAERSVLNRAVMRRMWDGE